MYKKKYEDGMIMVEAIYVVVIAIMVVFFGFNVAVMYHNRIVLTAIADEASTSVANTYGIPGKEPFYSYMDEEDFKRWNPYRYMTYGTHKFDTVVQQKGKWYTSFLISENEFQSEKNMDFSGIEVKCGKNPMSGVTQVTVSITRDYPAFVMNPVSFFGLEPVYTIKTTGTAVCYDVIHQMNTIAYMNEICEKAEKMVPILNVLSPARKIIVNTIKFWDTVTS